MRNLIERFNPIYSFIGQTRMLFLNHAFVSWDAIAKGFAVGLGMLIISCVLYNKTKNTMILHV